MINEHLEVARVEQFSPQWSETIVLKDGTRGFVRLAQKKDVELFDEYYAGLSPDDLYFRFFSRAHKDTIVDQRKKNFLKELGDTAHHKVFIIVDTAGALLGVCHAVELPVQDTRESGQFEIAFSSRMHNMGIGTALIRTVLAWAEHDPHVQKLKAVTMNENMGMRTLFERSGFLGKRDPDDISLIEYEKNIEHSKK